MDRTIQVRSRCIGDCVILPYCSAKRSILHHFVCGNLQGGALELDTQTAALTLRQLVDGHTITASSPSLPCTTKNILDLKTVFTQNLSFGQDNNNLKYFVDLARWCFSGVDFGRLNDGTAASATYYQLKRRLTALESNTVKQPTQS